MLQLHQIVLVIYSAIPAVYTQENKGKDSHFILLPERS